jgi:hypothetical protein
MKTKTAQLMNSSTWTPEGEEDDFRKISVFPSTEEILSVKSGQLSSKIRPNIVDGKYKNVMHYLDTHFRLLREDCLQPLREGIKEIIGTPHRSKTQSRDIRVYHDVVMRGIQCSRSIISISSVLFDINCRNGIVYRVSFTIDCEVAWERSKRLMYGALLCLSCDSFKTLMWATVANRDVSLLASSLQIDIRFPTGFEANFTPENVYTMVESSTTYFEAYQHVLKALQGLDIDRFPFAEHFIECSPNILPPSYLKQRDTYDLSTVFDGGRTTFPVLQKWPVEDINTSIDDSQMRALHQALTKRLAIIQGPPGTGKTFVGLKASVRIPIVVR